MFAEELFCFLRVIVPFFSEIEEIGCRDRAMKNLAYRENDHGDRVLSLLVLPAAYPHEIVPRRIEYFR
jgi:hypothetical protein